MKLSIVSKLEKVKQYLLMEFLSHDTKLQKNCPRIIAHSSAMCQLGESNSALQKWLIDLLWFLRGGVERQGNVPRSYLSKGIAHNVCVCAVVGF